jgi:DNA-binding transcriptional LysR family regulator
VTSDEEPRAHEHLPSPGLSSLRDLNDLEVFARVVEQNGFTRAARDLGVPASTVSRRLARLEEALGVRLLQRTTRKLHLTEAGQIYFEKVSRALREIETAEVLLRNVQGVPRGRIRVSTVSEPFIESVFFDFLEKFPEVTLELDKSHRRVDLISEGFDLAIRAGSLPDSSLIAHKLTPSGMMCVAAPSYLGRRGVPETLSDLADHDSVVVGTSTAGASWYFGTGDASEKVTVTGRLAVNNMATALAAVKRGLGIGMVPTHLIGDALKMGELVELLSYKAPPQSAIWVVYPSRTLRPPAVTALIDHIVEAFRTNPALPGP